MTPFQEWYKRYDEGGVDYLFTYDWKGRNSFLTSHQEAELVSWIEQTFPRDTTQVRAYITEQYGISYSHSGLIKLLHRPIFLNIFLTIFVQLMFQNKLTRQNSTKLLLKRIENAYKDKKTIHVFVDNARYHHA